jgi:hypothetical protein
LGAGSVPDQESLPLVATKKMDDVGCGLAALAAPAMLPIISKLAAKKSDAERRAPNAPRKTSACGMGEAFGLRRSVAFLG